MRISGAIIDGDARSYINYAEKMDLFSDNGFYSANFEKREPLYISLVKIFFLLFWGIRYTSAPCLFCILSSYDLSNLQNWQGMV